MLERSFVSVYDKFKLQFYRRVFELVREREGSLSATEAISLEVIKLLDYPTVGQFADFLNISQSNATYKVNSLIKKGYLERQNSHTDRREYHLMLSDKYYKYARLLSDYQSTVVERVSRRFPPEDTEKLDSMLRIISEELMPECSK
ncbi:MAG: MarR family winged helix-turn-helix transcriptional regulator [Candidatus Limivicinus sp.]